MKPAILGLMFLVWSCPSAFGLGQDQLYTGTASTVPPGLRQLQLYYGTTFNSGVELSGASLTLGVTSNADVRASYGYLWNGYGPNVQLGPNFGAKWRFLGDGRFKPSLSVSGLIGQNNGGSSTKNDLGGLLVLQYPTPSVIFLGNFGRVWVGEDVPDLRYTALALARPVAPRVLVAAQYIDVTPVSSGPPGRQLTEYVGAVVYHVRDKFGYSLQIGYVPRARNAHWNTTLGYSIYF